MKEFLLFLCCLLILGFLFIPGLAEAQTFRQTVTMAAGSGSYTIAPVYNTVATGARVEALIFGFGAGTATVNYVSGTITNRYGTKAVTASDKALVVSNFPALFAGDKLLITSSDTNAHSVQVIGTEF